MSDCVLGAVVSMVMVLVEVSDIVGEQDLCRTISGFSVFNVMSLFSLTDSL